MKRRNLLMVALLTPVAVAAPRIDAPYIDWIDWTNNKVIMSNGDEVFGRSVEVTGGWEIVITITRNGKNIYAEYSYGNTEPDSSVMSRKLMEAIRNYWSF